MVKPELVLSNTTTFFRGNIEAVFKKAKKHGFRFLELLPYRWNTPEQIYNLSREYGIEIAGIHMPPLREKEKTGFFDQLWNFYLGSAEAGPGIPLAELLIEAKQNPVPYVLFHADLIEKVPQQEREKLQNNLRLAIENVPGKPLQAPLLVFDPSHYLRSPHRRPEQDIAEIYRELAPEVLHISFDYPPLFHTLPKIAEQKALARMLKAHKPRYIVLETNPAVSVKRAKRLIGDLLAQAL